MSKQILLICLRILFSASTGICTCNVAIGVTKLHLNIQLLASLQRVLVAAPV